MPSAFVSLAGSEKLIFGMDARASNSNHLRHSNHLNSSYPGLSKNPSALLIAAPPWAHRRSLASHRSPVGYHRPRETTKEHLNEWITVKVNVKKHFKKFHDLDLDEINGIAIMADTDNSKLKSVSYYQNIYFSSD